MPYPNINISYDSNIVALAPKQDGVAMLVIYTTSTMLSIIPNRFTMRKMADMPSNLQNDAVIKFIRDFYIESGDGAILHVLPLPNSSLGIPIIKQHLQQLGGEVRLLVVANHIEGAYTPVMEGGLDAALRAQITAFQSLAEWTQSQYMPIQVLLEARSVTLASLPNVPNLTQFAANRVSVVCGSMLPEPQNINHAVGTVLGRLAKIAVSRKISAVKDGAIKSQYCFLGASEPSADAAKALHEKGFIAFRKHIGRQGWFLISDPTLATGGFDSIVRTRIADKVARTAYNTYLDELDDDIKQGAGGSIDSALIKAFQQTLQNAIEINCSGELSAISVVIDPNQDVVALGALAVAIVIVPLGYTSQININLSLKSKLDNA